MAMLCGKAMLKDEMGPVLVLHAAHSVLEHCRR